MGISLCLKAQSGGRVMNSTQYCTPYLVSRLHNGVVCSDDNYYKKRYTNLYSFKLERLLSNKIFPST